jgi:hypothetical protein
LASEAKTGAESDAVSTATARIRIGPESFIVQVLFSDYDKPWR